jgi:hypothetical protein
MMLRGGVVALKMKNPVLHGAKRGVKNEEPRFAWSKTGFLGGNWGDFRGKVAVFLTGGSSL